VNYSPALTQNMTWNYNSTSSGMRSFDLDFQFWEEDGCGSSNTYNTGCINDDDIYATGTASINWRNSPPNTWNGLDLPIKTSGRNASWSVGIEYRWSYNDPTANIVDAGNYGTGTKNDRVLCALSESTTLYSTTENAMYYQWQEAREVTGPDPDPSGECPVNVEWRNIGGAVCSFYSPPSLRGTRIYRVKVMNRNGDGSQSGTGSYLAEGYSECVRVTYFPFTPRLESAVCNTAVFGGINSQYQNHRKKEQL